MVIEALLEKSRRINKILQKTAGQHVDFKGVAMYYKMWLKLMSASDRSGKILGISTIDSLMVKWLVETSPTDYNAMVSSYDEAEVNLQQDDSVSLLLIKSPPLCLLGGGKRLGTL